MSAYSDMLKLIGVIVVRQINARIRTGKISPQTNKRGTTLVNRGKLMRSIKYRTDGNSVIISAGSATVPYARIHHEGGVIKPKNAKYLAIPITAQAKLYKPRDYPGQTFIAKGVIFLKVDGGKPVPLYVLKKQVTIPARPYMFVDDGDKAQLREACKTYITARLKELPNVT